MKNKEWKDFTQDEKIERLLYLVQQREFEIRDLKQDISEGIKKLTNDGKNMENANIKSITNILVCATFPFWQQRKY